VGELLDARATTGWVSELLGLLDARAITGWVGELYNLCAY